MEKKSLIPKQKTVSVVRMPKDYENPEGIQRAIKQERVKEIARFLKDRRREEFEKCILSKFKKLPSEEITSILWNYYS